jgi:hypothetical protein
VCDVLFEVRAEFLNIIYMIFGFRGLIVNVLGRRTFVELTCFLKRSAWTPSAGSTKAICCMTSSIDHSDGSAGVFGGASE